MTKERINSYIKEIKQFSQDDINFLLASVAEMSSYKRSRRKIIAAVEILHSHEMFNDLILEFYLKGTTKKFRSVTLVNNNDKLKKYSALRLTKRLIGNSGFLASNDFSKESRMRARFIKEMEITRSVYFSVSSYGVLAVDTVNGNRQLSSHEIKFIKLYLKIVVAPSVELAIDNESNFKAAIHDPLTGLYNKGYFSFQLDKECESLRGGGTLSLILIDLDHFKIFNDTYGHPAGDKLLKILSKILFTGVRKYDTVARYGGEEFVIILPCATIDIAKFRADEIRKAVANHVYNIKEMKPDHKITISLGVANIPYNASNCIELVSMADKGLYVSKENGRNKVSVVEKN